MKYKGRTKKSRRGKKVSKAVKSYVRKALRQDVETKTTAFSAGGNAISKDTIVSWNIMYQCGITQGTGQQNVIGDIINLRGIKTTFTYRYTGADAIYGYMALIETRLYNTITSLTNSEVFHTTSTSIPNFDSSKCRVLGLKKMKIFNAAGSGDTQQRSSMYIRVNKKFTFSQLATSTAGRDKNYYLVFFADRYLGTAGTAITGLTYNIEECRIYFKDP